jgi:tRNA G46 methylase TrmB
VASGIIFLDGPFAVFNDNVEPGRVLPPGQNCMVLGTSGKVSSGQREPHPGLDAILEKHFSIPWLQPLHRPSVLAFERLAGMADLSRRGLVLDSGCGTGFGTRALARRHPSSLVIGVDRSARRLGKTGHRSFPVCEDNVVWVRAELATFWRLALEAGWRLERHYILYPNPWPKKSQIRRRWHAHPAFPALLKLGGILELRTNWQLYAREFARSVEWATGENAPASEFSPGEPLTAFERKYSASGHALYRVVSDLG